MTYIFTTIIKRKKMIIYKGNIIIPEYPKRRTCKNCKSELGIEEKDIIKINDFNLRGETYKVNGFTCPVCQTSQKLN